MSLINQLPAITKKSAKRVGRGYGSGKGGHTASRGQKGQRSRNGGKIALWFEGGQLPLVKRLPMMRGKLRLSKVRPVYEVRLADLEKIEVEKVTLDTLKIAKVIPEKATSAKVVVSGKLTKAVTLEGIKTTKKARELIEAAGGQVL